MLVKPSLSNHQTTVCHCPNIICVSIMQGIISSRGCQTEQVRYSSNWRKWETRNLKVLSVELVSYFSWHLINKSYHMAHNAKTHVFLYKALFQIRTGVWCVTNCFLSLVIAFFVPQNRQNKMVPSVEQQILYFPPLFVDIEIAMMLLESHSST